MATEDNEFDIDIYGDDGNQDYQQEDSNDTSNQADTIKTETMADAHDDSQSATEAKQEQTQPTPVAKQEPEETRTNGSVQTQNNTTQQIASTGESGHAGVQLPKQAPIQQGTKRKDGADDRPTDSGATTALLIQELHWWTTEDDIRGWANQAECEDELKDITFNEHKVNGKSKGQVYVEMATAQAATALKHKIESFGDGQAHARRPQVSFNPPHINPYKTLPKDVPGRKGDNRSENSGRGNFSQNKFNSGGFNNNRGNYNNRGGGMNTMNNFSNNNRNFSPPMNNMNPGGFNSNPMGGFNNMGGGMNNFNFNRGGMMGGNMRGGMNNRGRGGMGNNMMGGMPNMGGMGMGNMGGMGGMPMGGMGGNMNMGMGMGMQTFSFLANVQQQQARQQQQLLQQQQQGPRNGSFGSEGSQHSRPTTQSPQQLPLRQKRQYSPPPEPGSPMSPPSRTQANAVTFTGGFGGQGHFNPAFFNQAQQGGGDGNWQPPNKRPRQD